jgi:small subunit ribosomal protein S17
MPRRRLQGTVVSNRMDKTVVVRVERLKAHPIYRKVMRLHRRYMAHDEANEAQIGDAVVIEECRPLSRRKRWQVVERVQRGAAR